MLFKVLLLAYLCELHSLVLASAVKGSDSNNYVELENGYTKISFDKRFGFINSISSDFSGSSNYSENILSDSFGLEVKRVKNNCLQKIKPIPTVEWIERSSKSHKVKITNVLDCSFSPVISETWTISLTDSQRAVEVSIDGVVLQDVEVEYIAHSLYVSSTSLYGLFDRGVAQMMDNQDACLGSSDPLGRAYFLGGGGALDFLRLADSSSRPVVLLSKTNSFNSGIQSVLYGDYPNTAQHMSTAWNILCWYNATSTSVKAGGSYSASYSLIPNSADFPVYLLNDLNAPVQNSLPALDMQTYLTGIYASPVGCLQSYYQDQTGIIAPTISHPDVGYSPDANFFDPDNFLSLSALLYSSDAYLVDQVRLVLERTAQTMCGVGNDTLDSYCRVGRQRLTHTPLSLSQFSPSVLKSSSSSSSGSSGSGGVLTAETLQNTRSGQLMHHFVSLVPTYESIAGSEQLGPNVFWSLTALKYMSVTQDDQWALQMFDYLLLSTKFLLTFFDPAVDLVMAPGPLWIDVIVRENYTSDSNAMMVPVLLELADYFDYVVSLQDTRGVSLSVSVEGSFTSTLRDISARISAAMNANLWNATCGDHYVTQLNRDGTTRDFVDYDSNLLAVAFGIAPSDRAASLLERVDNGEHTHIRATWCSEQPYSGDADDCYIVGGDVCGDSVVTLARIGWVDALARKAVNDLSTFEDLLLTPLQRDLVNSTWLYERYDENGTQIRTSYYFEYPSLVTMLLHDIRYGLSLSLTSLRVDPFPPAPFSLALGDVSVVYSPAFLSLSFPGPPAAAPKTVTAYNVAASASFVVVSSCAPSDVSTAVSSSSGTLTFSAALVKGCTITATQQ